MRRSLLTPPPTAHANRRSSSNLETTHPKSKSSIGVRLWYPFPRYLLLAHVGSTLVYLSWWLNVLVFRAFFVFEPVVETGRAASSGDAATVPAAPRSPRRRKISEDLENTPSPHKAGVQRHIVVPKPMKL